MKWWPDWKRPVTWLLGFTFGCNNSIYYASSSVLPEFLSHGGRSHLISGVLLWLNLGQIAALILMLWLADRMVHRAWPFVVFGLLAFAGLLALPFVDGVCTDVKFPPVSPAGSPTSATFVKPGVPIVAE